MEKYTTAVRSHWLTDGGVLQNKPLGPALREIFERPADHDVRRLLLYVVPSADGASADGASADGCVFLRGVPFRGVSVMR
jgi:hypothetical protein